MIRQHYWPLGSKEEGQEGKDHEQKKEKRKNKATEKCEIRGSVVKRRPGFGSQYPTVTHNSLFLLFRGISHLLSSLGTRHTHGTLIYIQAKIIIHINF